MRPANRDVDPFGRGRRRAPRDIDPDIGSFAMSSSAALSMTHKEENAWRNFNPGDWCTSIDVRDFIVRNVDAL